MQTTSPFSRTPRNQRRFRPAPSTTGRPADHGPGIRGQLCDEWVRLCASPRSTAELTRWQQTCPELRGARDLAHLLDVLDASPRPSKDAILRNLVLLNADGRQMAGRTVLQAMLPKLSRLHQSLMRPGTFCDSHEDALVLTISTFWEVLSTYPAQRRPRNVAAGLGLDTLHRITDRGHVTEIPVDHREHPTHVLYATHLDRTVTNDRDLQRIEATLPDTDADILEVFAWALERRAITPTQAALLVQAYAPVDPSERVRLQELAAQHGISHPVMNQRVSRARRALLAAFKQASDVVTETALTLPCPVA